MYFTVDDVKRAVSNNAVARLIHAADTDRWGYTQLTHPTSLLDVIAGHAKLEVVESTELVPEPPPAYVTVIDRRHLAFGLQQLVQSRPWVYTKLESASFQDRSLWGDLVLQYAAFACIRYREAA